MSMRQRQTILAHALAHIPRQSFTQRALVSAGAQPECLEAVLGANPERQLVREWEKQGLRAMGGGEARKMGGKAQREVDLGRVRGALAKRLEWSGKVGEHLVQAYALLATPEKELSAPLPKPLTTLIASLGSKLRLDAPYVPPQETPMTITPQLPSSPPPATLTLPLLNPLPLISYALTIADEALYVSGAEPETKSGELDWYTRRLGLALIYLHAETHLLRPRPAHSSTDPQIPLAMRQLDESLARYRRLSEANARLGEVEKQMGQFGWFVWKSWGGLFRSRGWIN
ncbi:hypothetical protein NliqN6_2300 [Naganishia liquefaciens]|uniref:COQ9 C-terminal domain-containing protein n=1 Tax=Naganishia liquefaciens TaxID=104408 RepID=A0A8H3YE50_9TREE|nr:hypothetical protein NliqN6_2300 [Naganishia liquefaciens]